MIPIAILAATAAGQQLRRPSGRRTRPVRRGGVGILDMPVLPMLLLRKKYPR